MNKLGMVLATLVALLGATAGWAQDTEESEPAAAAVAEPATAAAAVAEPVSADTGCCENSDCRGSRCRGRVMSFFERAGCFRECKDRNACGSDCEQGCEKNCDKGCGKRCSLRNICEWLCFRRDRVCCPKGPAPCVPPLYTFFPCDDCGDGCGGACANNDCCNTCNK